MSEEEKNLKTIELINQAANAATKIIQERIAFTTRLLAPLAGINDLPDYEPIESSPWYKNKLQLSLVQRCIISITNHRNAPATHFLNTGIAKLPQDLQVMVTHHNNAQNILNEIIKFWLPLKLKFPEGHYFPTEIDNHYIALCKATLNGARPTTPLALSDALTKIVTLDTRYEDLPVPDWTAHAACYKACRSIILPNLKDPEPQTTWYDARYGAWCERDHRGRVVALEAL